MLAFLTSVFLGKRNNGVFHHTKSILGTIFSQFGIIFQIKDSLAPRKEFNNMER
jgi:hypothetical protein